MFACECFLKISLGLFHQCWGSENHDVIDQCHQYNQHIINPCKIKTWIGIWLPVPHFLGMLQNVLKKQCTACLVLYKGMLILRTATWIVLFKPIRYIHIQFFAILRSSLQKGSFNVNDCWCPSGIHVPKNENYSHSDGIGHWCGNKVQWKVTPIHLFIPPGVKSS